MSNEKKCISVWNWEEIYKKLSAPFDPNDIDWKIAKTFEKNGKLVGVAVPFVSNRAIQKRLDESLGTFGWKNEYKEWQNGSQLCGISVRVIYEDGSFEWITKWDGADSPTYEPIKGGLSDSMKRAAGQWSVGRYLHAISEYVEVYSEDGKTIFPRSEKERLRALLEAEKSDVPYSQEKTSSQQQISNQRPSNNDYEINQNTQRPDDNGNTTINKVSKKQVNFINNLLQRNNADIKSILAKYNVRALEELSSGQASGIIQDLIDIAS